MFDSYLVISYEKYPYYIDTFQLHLFTQYWDVRDVNCYRYYRNRQSLQLPVVLIFDIHYWALSKITNVAI